MDIDNLKVIRKFDSAGMLGILESFPGQVSRAKEIGLGFRVPSGLKKNYKNIVFTGLGGSAIGADIIRSYIAGESSVPVFVNRNYLLPGFVNKDTLLVVSSYSGNTEETLSAYRDARKKKAVIVAITSGGRLRQEAEKDGTPFILIPPGLPPRCSLGYSFFPSLILLCKLGIINNKIRDIDETITLLGNMVRTSLGAGVAGKLNKAKSIARAAHRRFPVIYSACDHIDSVAVRWRGQFAENSKTLASSHLFPEMCHNEIVGWENPDFMLKNSIAIFLRDRADLDRVSKRMDIVKDMLADNKVKVLEIKSAGKSLLARIFSLIYVGDFASFYLAILNGCDPTPVERISYLKERLART